MRAYAWRGRILWQANVVTESTGFGESLHRRLRAFTKAGLMAHMVRHGVDVAVWTGASPWTQTVLATPQTERSGS